MKDKKVRKVRYRIDLMTYGYNGELLDLGYCSHKLFDDKELALKELDTLNWNTPMTKSSYYQLKVLTYYEDGTSTAEEYKETI